MAHQYGHSGSSTSGTSGTSAARTTNNSGTSARTTTYQGQVAPPGFHYMPDGTLMSDADHDKLYGKVNVLKKFEMDFSDLPSYESTRKFIIYGTNGSKFTLEIKNEDGYYYNFITNVFEAAYAKLSETISGKFYKGNVTFPLVGDDDQYDFLLLAEPGTKHVDYTEFRFLDESVDINSCVGSNSLMMRKVIYQYTEVTLTLNLFSPNAVTDIIKTSTLINDTIDISRSEGIKNKSFTMSCEVNAATKAYQIIKQPTSNDILSFVLRTLGSAPEKLPGERIYPAITTAADSTSEGGTTVNGASTGTTVTTHVISSTIATVGDRVLGNTELSSKSVTVTAVSAGSGKTFTISEAVSIADDLPLTFSNQKNYQWPLDNIQNISTGMIVLGSNLESNTTTTPYQSKTKVFEGTSREKTIINYLAPATVRVEKPTVVNGLISSQGGKITFNKQQKLVNAGDDVKIGGYGESQIFNIYGWDVRFSNLSISLNPISTTTTSAVVNSVTVPVAAVDGILPNVSTYSGIGTGSDTYGGSQFVTARSATSGAGNLTVTDTLNLENGATLSFANAGQVATVTGDIEIIKAGIAGQTLRFDVEKFLSIT